MLTVLPELILNATTGVVAADCDALATVVVDGDVLGHSGLTGCQRDCVWACAGKVERDRVAGAYVGECVAQRAGTTVGSACNDRVRSTGIDNLGHDVAL